ncbi:acyltransferase family protein [Streptomyces flaveolus]|uniref:acyltransferase family protein n=1 Tax=Streptomyces flaveolus TaxID=67297 RepID=UPI0036BDEB8B
MATDQVLTGSAPAGARGTSAATPPRRAPSRLPSLTGLRFLAALAVLPHHAFLPIPPLRLLADDATQFRSYRWFNQAGGPGVPFFFVLSGFVLTWPARHDDTTTSFWRRRFVKIYPVYVIARALAMGLFAAPATSDGVAVADLFVVHVWVPEYFTNFSVDCPSWSLGVEAFFYLCFPLLLRLFQRIDAAHLKYWIAGVIAAVWATPALAYGLFSKTELAPSGPT